MRDRGLFLNKGAGMLIEARGATVNCANIIVLLVSAFLLHTLRCRRPLQLEIDALAEKNGWLENPGQGRAKGKLEGDKLKNA